MKAGCFHPVVGLEPSFSLSYFVCQVLAFLETLILGVTCVSVQGIWDVFLPKGNFTVFLQGLIRGTCMRELTIVCWAAEIIYCLECLSNSSKWNHLSETFNFPILFKQESLLDLQRKITKVNCSVASEQMERILQAYLILVEHANGSKISLPEDVCQVGQTVTWMCQRSISWIWKRCGQLKHSYTFLMHHWA